MKHSILVVDDDASIRETFEHHLARSGHPVATAASAEEALNRMSEVDPALVITDLRLPGMDGLELLRHLRAAAPDVDVLLITAHEDMSSAMEAMKDGAYDYMVKPLDLDRIDRTIERCFSDRRFRRETRKLPGAVGKPATPDHHLVGRDARMIEIYKLIGSLAGNRAPVLIRGETGTGKELIARAIHANSAAADEPFVAVNCTALSETLLESELFGHVRGAFTGAVTDHQGRFDLAGAGTIFLDEIGDVSLSFQAKLLRVLENHEFFPVGGERSRRTDARVIAATNRPIEERAESGQFRQDLYFRLKVVEIWVPPLRERRDDILLLTEYLLQRVAENLGGEVHVIADDALAMLVAYDWPGNVRELENALTRAAVMARGSVITAEHLSLGPGNKPAASTVHDGSSLHAAERAHVQRVLHRTGGNKRQAARILDISRPRLDRLIAKYNLVVTKRDPRGHDS